MTELTLAASPRTRTGKSPARSLRRAGQVPGVIYGVRAPQPVQCDGPSLHHLVDQRHGLGRMITLEVSDGKGDGKVHKVILKEVQKRPVGNHILHVDFHEVDVDKPVHVSVVVQPRGQAEGVRLGGILQTVTHDVTVECLPALIPEYLEVDITGLEIGRGFHVGDLDLPEGITVLNSPDDTIFVVNAPITEAQLEEELAELPEEGAVPEVAAPTAAEAAGTEETGG